MRYSFFFYSIDYDWWQKNWNVLWIIIAAHDVAAASQLHFQCWVVTVFNRIMFMCYDVL